MSRHRDVRKMNYDDYADDYDDGDEYDEQYYGEDDGCYDARATAPKPTAASSAPKQTAQSNAFFKTKPAKGGKKTNEPSPAPAVASTSSSSASSRPPPGFSVIKPSSSNDGLSDQFDADTRAAIAASLAEANPSTSPTPTTSLRGSPQPIRSSDAARDTEAALEQIRLEKIRAKSGNADALSATSTPKRQVSNASESPSGSPMLSSLNSSPSVSRIDRANLPSGGKLPAAALQVPDSGSSNPTTPRSASSGSADASEVGAAAPATASVKRTKEVQAALEADASLAGGDTKDRLNMVCIGHVDSGKSTLMGHLLFLQGRVSKKLMHKYEKESKEMGKSSFHFAWVLDETDEERSRGITTDVAVNWFETPTKKITLLDAPGHKEFIPNMITGAAQADAAILVVTATKGEFESGFSEDGQTREHATLARSLGVSQLVLAVNKLDTCEWSKKRYDEIVAQMIPFLKSVGYKEKDIWPIPISGLTGENIMDRKEPLLKEWYSDGPVLLDLIDKFSLPTRHTDKPLRMCIQDVFKTLTLGQVVAGKLESGSILLKDKMLLLPLGETISVKAMESRGENMSVARAGDNVEIGIKDFSDPAVLQVGQWLCDPQHPIPMVTHFRAQIITMNYKIPLLSGSQLTFFTQATTEPIAIHSVQAIVDKVTGAVIKKSPRVLPRDCTAIVELVSKNKICLELFRNYKELGRFTLRRGHETVAVGITIKLYRMHS